MKHLFEQGRNVPSTMLDAFPTMPSTVKHAMQTSGPESWAELTPRASKPAKLELPKALDLGKISDRLTSLIRSHNPAVSGMGTRPRLSLCRNSGSLGNLRIALMRIQKGAGEMGIEKVDSVVIAEEHKKDGEKKEGHRTMVARYNEMMHSIDKLCDDVGKLEKKEENSILELYRADRDNGEKQYAAMLKCDKKIVLAKHIKGRFRNGTIKKFITMPERGLNP